jgi:hypothetical protein
MRASLIAIVLSGVGGAVCAQAANERPTGLESCFQSARGADSICSSPANDAVQRLDCLQKARATLLECLEHVPPDSSAGSAAPEEPAATTGSVMPSGTAAPELPAATVLPDRPTAAASPDQPTAISPEKSAAAASPDLPRPAVDTAPKPPDTNWVVSETTSPVDFSPLITAAIRLPFSVKPAPNSLAIRCRGQRTELLVRTEGTWRASRSSEVQVDYQINDQPFVKLAWTASADGKTVTYKDDPIGFLQSLPESARLKISVLDGPGPSHEATFQLAGLDVVRQKIALACKWPPAANKTSSQKR